MPPDEPTEEEAQQQLPQDGQTPFQPADPNPSPTGNTTDPVVADSAGAEVPDDHPATDTNIDPTELYDEGVGGAAEVSQPNAGSAATDFTPPSTPPADPPLGDDQAVPETPSAEEPVEEPAPESPEDDSPAL